MKSKYFFTSAVAILAIALVGHAEGIKKTGVVSVGPIMPTVSTPRLRVTNDRPEPVDIWFVPGGADELQYLGSVVLLGTETFTIPDTVKAIRIIVRPQATPGQYVSNDITIDERTDVGLRVAGDLNRTTLILGELDVVRPSDRRDAPSTTSENTPQDA